MCRGIVELHHNTGDGDVDVDVDAPRRAGRNWYRIGDKAKKGAAKYTALLRSQGTQAKHESLKTPNNNEQVINFVFTSVAIWITSLAADPTEADDDRVC